jgi:hypothetical protein
MPAAVSRDIVSDIGQAPAPRGIVMTEPTPPAPDKPEQPTYRKPTVAELLARALESLTSEERQRVTAWMLARTTAATAAGLGGLGVPPNRELAEIMGPDPRSLREMYTGRAGGRDQQVVPVRLPADLHARLRLWCTRHGFSMATVIRGLVARFLDGQPPVEATDPAEPTG